MEKEDRKQIVRKPWKLTRFEESETYTLSKMFFSGGGVRFSKINFREEDMPSLARALVKLKMFKKEFNKAKREEKKK